MDGWMTSDFTSFSIVFQSYQDDVQSYQDDVRMGDNERVRAIEPGLLLKGSPP